MTDWHFFKIQVGRNLKNLKTLFKKSLRQRFRYYRKLQHENSLRS